MGQYCIGSWCRLFYKIPLIPMGVGYDMACPVCGKEYKPDGKEDKKEVKSPNTNWWSKAYVPKKYARP